MQENLGRGEGAKGACGVGTTKAHSQFLPMPLPIPAAITLTEATTQTHNRIHNTTTLMA